MLYQRCGKKVSATVNPFDAAWQIAPPATCSPLAALHVSVLAAEGGANHTPVAEAGPDQTVKAGTLVTLDGSHSTDEDGNALTYRWWVVSKPAGGKVTLKGATSVWPTVKFNVSGTYVLGLTVRDGALTSALDTCTLTTVNSRPVADAGPGQTVAPGTTPQIYIVKQGDTLSSIALEFGISIDALKTANALSSDLIYPDQQLFIPANPIELTSPAMVLEDTHVAVVTSDSYSLSGEER